MEENLPKKRSQFIELIDSVASVLVIIIGISVLTYFLLPEYLSPVVAREAAKDPNNIKRGGCLRYATKGKYMQNLYYFNEIGPISLRQITVKEFPFNKNWIAATHNIDFEKKYHTECFKIKYVPYQALWFSDQKIYDVDISN